MLYVVVEPDGLVSGFIPPDTPLTSVEFDHIAGKMLIEVTIENSPAYVNGTWDGIKFHPPQGVEV